MYLAVQTRINYLLLAKIVILKAIIYPLYSCNFYPFPVRLDNIDYDMKARCTFQLYVKETPKITKYNANLPTLFPVEKECLPSPSEEIFVLFFPNLLLGLLKDKIQLLKGKLVKFKSP